MDSNFCKHKYLAIINNTVLPQPVFPHCYVRTRGYIAVIHIEPWSLSNLETIQVCNIVGIKMKADLKVKEANLTLEVFIKGETL